MSCHVLQHVQWHHECIVRRAHIGKPATLIIRGTPGITYGHAIRTDRMIFIKNNCLTT